MKTARRTILPRSASREAPRSRSARPLASRTEDAFAVGLHRRLRKVASLVPAVLEGESSDAVHDIRVWSRRLQQGLDASFPKPRPRPARKARRRLRRLRRALGEWRNLDVVLELAAARRQASRDACERRAWDLVSGALREAREQEIVRARALVSAIDLDALRRGTTRLVERTRGRRPQGLRAAAAAALACWNDRVATARATRSPADLHALRIATKRLRYRLELSRELADPPPPKTLAWMKDLQQRLGSWHDREVLRARVAETLARPEILLAEPDAVRGALVGLERERAAETAEVERILARTERPEALVALRDWARE